MKASFYFSSPIPLLGDLQADCENKTTICLKLNGVNQLDRTNGTELKVKVTTKIRFVERKFHVCADFALTSRTRDFFERRFNETK